MPKKANIVPYAGKVVASVFWDARGKKIFIVYLQKGKIINGDYNAYFLQRFSEKIKEKGCILSA